MSLQRILIVGLGNPGPKYERTRHNAGFWLVEALAAQLHGSFRAQAKMHSEICEVDAPQGGPRLILAKPQTYMNRSGLPVRALCDYYKLPLDSVLVAHDDLDLPPGRARLKRGGGAGGHNGLKDIIRHCGGDFLRLRLGVGHPGQREAVLGHVLSAAGAAEQRELDAAIEAGREAVLRWLDTGWDSATQALHSST